VSIMSTPKLEIENPMLASGSAGGQRKASQAHASAASGTAGSAKHVTEDAGDSDGPGTAAAEAALPPRLENVAFEYDSLCRQLEWTPDPHAGDVCFQ
jgi:hypothetical protein